MPFLPSDLSGGILWLKGDALTGLGEGAPVGTWADSFGTGNNATQATASKRPAYRADYVNGKPAVQFDGVDDYLGANLGALPSPFTIFVVVRFATLNQGLGDFEYLINIGDGSVNMNVSVARHGDNGTDTNKYYTFDGTAGRFGSVLAGQTWLMLAATHKTSAPRHTLHKSGAADTVQDYPSNLSTNGSFRLGMFASEGAGFAFNGHVAEVIVYNRALSDSERQQVESYLNTKYFVAPSVGTSDPSFHDVVYPLSLERCLSTHEWLTNIMELGDQSEQRIPIGSDGRRKFDASHGVRSLADLQALLKFHALRHGETYGFKVRDLVDYKVARGPEGTLQHAYNGTSKSFQLQKIYSDSAAVWIREIYKPEQGSVKVYKNAALLTEGVDYNITYTTGIITFTTAPVNGDVIEWEGRFYVPVRFAIKEIPAAEFVASMQEVDGQWQVRGGTVDLPEVSMIEVRNI